ncbi:MAG: hypothetical protein ACXVCH_17040, partial [Bdellovibrionota bacterium]
KGRLPHVPEVKLKDIGPRTIIKAKAAPAPLQPGREKPFATKSLASAFMLSPAGPGRLILNFHAPAGQDLDPKAPITIELFADTPVEVAPTLITRAEWPKSGSAMNLTYKGAPAKKKPAHIYGKAAFTTCDRRNKKCSKNRAAIDLRFVP